MSDILIRGMEMPKNCICCDLSHEDGWCPAKQDYIDRYSFETCPLIPVPPHGRLIDADALWVEINKICDRRDAGVITDLTCLQQILSAVRHAPTIIPAEPCNNLSKPCKEEGE